MFYVRSTLAIWPMCGNVFEHDKKVNFVFLGKEAALDVMLLLNRLVG